MSVNACFSLANQTIAVLKSRLAASVEEFKDPTIRNFYENLLDEYGNILSTTNAADLTTEFLEVLGQNLRHDVLKILDTARAQIENTNFVQKVLDQGVNSKQGIREVINNFNQRTLNLKEREVLWLNRERDKLFDNLYLRGELDEQAARRAKDAFDSHLAGGGKLKRLLRDYGVEGDDIQDREIFKALKQGNYKQDDPIRSIPELHAIGKVFRELDDMVIARLQKNGSPIHKLDNHVNAISESRSKLLRLGKERFAEKIMEHVDLEKVLGKKGLTKKNINKWIESRFESTLR